MTPLTGSMSPGGGMRVLDLFSGIGGFSLGLERTGGFQTVAFCEIALKCRFLLNYHWPNVPCFDDVRTLKGSDVGEVDVICGGFPCQDISFAGRGAGLAGERSGLWSEYVRLIGELRPRIVIVENVAALVVRGLGTVLGDLAALGYDAWWDCIPACAVGAPHRRDRLWIVAYARGQQHEGFGDALRRSIAAELAGHANGHGEPARALDDETPGLSGVVADTPRLQRGRAQQRAQRERIGAGGEHIDAPDAAGERRDEGHAHAGGGGQGSRAQQGPGPGRRGWWLSEPDVGRVAHGVPARVDRLHGLGNAVVPQIPELIARAILSASPSVGD